MEATPSCPGQKTEGREKRRNAEAEMQRMEDELKKKLLEIRN